MYITVFLLLKLHAFVKQFSSSSHNSLVPIFSIKVTSLLRSLWRSPVDDLNSEVRLYSELHDASVF